MYQVVSPWESKGVRVRCQQDTVVGEGSFQGSQIVGVKSGPGQMAAEYSGGGGPSSGLADRERQKWSGADGSSILWWRMALFSGCQYATDAAGEGQRAAVYSGGGGLSSSLAERARHRWPGADGSSILW